MAFNEYPKWMYKGGEEAVVMSAADETALGPGWSEFPVKEDKKTAAAEALSKLRGGK